MMDSEVSLLLDCAAWNGLRRFQVQVEICESFNRQTDAGLEQDIHRVWTERWTKQPWLFNGAKFRLHSFKMASLDGLQPPRAVAHLDDAPVPGEDVACEAPPLLTLRLGLTCYKDYLGTNWSGRADELRGRGEREFGDRLALLAQPLGVGAVMSTSDGKVVLIRRSQKVAEAGGLLDIPGGHPEPKVVCEGLGRTVGEQDITTALLRQKPDAVVAELFSSVCAEIRDEVNVPLGFLAEPVLMGVALNHTSAGRPSAEFHVSCSLTSDEVTTLYWEGGAEAHESTDVVFITTREMLLLDQNVPLWSDLCPSAKGAILLFQKVRPDAGTSGPRTSR